MIKQSVRYRIYFIGLLIIFGCILLCSCDKPFNDDRSNNAKMSASDVIESTSGADDAEQPTGECGLAKIEEASYETDEQCSSEYDVETNEQNTSESNEETSAYMTMFDQIRALADERDEDLIIELDPGHGGIQEGASSPDGLVPEKNVNLKIALYLKEELEKYSGVKVCLTRSDDEDLDIEYRVKKAVMDQADVLISLHNNAKGDIAEYDHGCTVLVARGVYEPELSLVGQELACCILQELEGIGIENQGLMFRVCQNGSTYPNSTLCDYYGIIRNAVLSGIPGILIEHSFIDKEYDTFLKTDEQLRELAQADARGISRYFGLTKTGEEREKLEPYEAFITTITTDYYSDNQYQEKEYFK